MDTKTNTKTSYQLTEETHKILEDMELGNVVVILNSTRDIFMEHTIPKIPQNKIKIFMENEIKNIFQDDSQDTISGYTKKTPTELLVYSLNNSNPIKNIIKVLNTNITHIITLQEVLKTINKDNQGLASTILIYKGLVSLTITKGFEVVYHKNSLLFPGDSYSKSVDQLIEEGILLCRRNYKGEIYKEITIINTMKDTSRLKKYAIPKEVPTKKTITYQELLESYSKVIKPYDLGYLTKYTQKTILNIIVDKLGRPVANSLVLLFLIFTIIILSTKAYVKGADISSLKTNEETIRMEIQTIDSDTSNILSKEYNILDSDYKEGKDGYIKTSKVLKDLTNLLPKDSTIRNLTISKDGLITANIVYDFTAYNISSVVNKMNSAGIFEEITMEDIIVTTKITDITVNLKYIK